MSDDFIIRNISFWDTCYGDKCVSFRAGLVDGPDWAPYPYNRSDQFVGWFGHYNVNVIAWGFQYPSHSIPELYYGESGWGYSTTPYWNGFNFMYYTEWPDFEVGGPWFENAMWQGFWSNDIVPFNTMRMAWRGKLDDGSTFDCIQVNVGDTECNVITPEPSISLMVVTGLMFTLLFNRWRRRR